MRNSLLTILSLGILTTLLASGCKKDDETQPPNTAANYQQPGQPGYQQPQGGYQQQPQGGYQQQPGTYQQQPGTYPPQPGTTQPAGATTAQPAAATGSPTPNAIATACRSDADCIGARCNLQAQKCQFPCGSNTDCQTGWACTLGACAPNMNTQPH